MIEDIYNGHGVLFLDPHGVDTDDLIQYIPKHRQKDTILFDPSDCEWPIAWDFFDIDAHKAVIANAVDAAIRDTVSYSSATPLMSMYLRSAVFSLLDAGEPIIGLPYLLRSVEKGFRTGQQRYIEKFTHCDSQNTVQVFDRVNRRFWIEYDNMSDADKRKETGSAYNKALAMIMDERIRNVIGQRKGAFSMRDVLDGKIVLARLPEGQLGRDQSRMLGIMLLSQLNLTAKSKPATVPTRVYITEAHTFAGQIVTEMLTGIRKFGVSITIEHQSLSQIEDRSLGDTMLGNTAKKYIFRVSVEDDARINVNRGINHHSHALYDIPQYEAVVYGGKKNEREDVKPLDFPIFKDAFKNIQYSNRRHYARPEADVTLEINRFIDDA